MAGGKLLIGEEFILTLALSDEELAYLLAHEMAHVLAEHTREFATYARYFVSNGLAREYEDLQQELDESIGLQMRMAFLSAQQELEADYMGFILGARAGVEPAAMLSLLCKLRSDSGSLPVSHPSDERRSQQAQAMLRQPGASGRAGRLFPERPTGARSVAERPSGAPTFPRTRARAGRP